MVIIVVAVLVIRNKHEGLLGDCLFQCDSRPSFFLSSTFIPLSIIIIVLPTGNSNAGAAKAIMVLL